MGRLMSPGRMPYTGVPGKVFESVGNKLHIRRESGVSSPPFIYSSFRRYGCFTTSISIAKRATSTCITCEIRRQSLREKHGRRLCSASIRVLAPFL